MLKFKSLLKAKSSGSKAEGGFTLLEVLVAIAILSAGTAVSVNVIASSVSLAPKIKDRTVAVHLAQEGIEIVKNIRDINWVNNNPFNTGLNAGWACVEYNLNFLDYNCALNGGSEVLSFDGTYYGHGGLGSLTDFSRRVTITDVSAVEIKVVSDVSCGVNCSVSLEDHLFDWK